METIEQGYHNAHEDLIYKNSLLFEKQTENLASYQMNFLKVLIDGVEKEFIS